MVWQPDYATTAQVKNYLGIVDTVDDVELAAAITAASSAINGSCGRQFGKSDTATLRSYDAIYNRHRPYPTWIVPIDDLYDAAGLVVTVGGVTISAAGYTLEDRNAPANGKPFELLAFTNAAEARPSDGTPRVDITTDKWGWAAIPTTVLQACKLQTGRFDARKRALFGVAGSPADGSEMRLLAKLDPDVDVMLTDYRRRWAAG